MDAGTGPLSRRPLAVAHQLLDLADAAGGGAPHLLLEAGLALLHQLLNRLAALEGIPELALELGPLDEIPALQPHGQLPHRSLATAAS